MAVPLSDQVALLRRKRKISQKQAAAALGVSPSSVSRMESGDAGDNKILRRYLAWLTEQRPRSRENRGRAAKPVNVKSRTVRGEPLLHETACANALPEGWKLLFVTRVSRDTELGALYHRPTDDFGLVAFRASGNGVVVGDVIRFEKAFDGGGADMGAYKALGAFCSDRLPKEIRAIYAPDEYT